MKTLNMLHNGEHAVICKLSSPEAMRRRLEDLGFVPGTLVECILHAPAGDPSAYEIRGATIALRSEDAAGIGVY